MARVPRPPRSGRGRPRHDHDDFEDASLAARIRALADKLGRSVDNEQVRREALRRGYFQSSQLAAFGRRATLDYIDRCLTGESPETGYRDRIPVPKPGDKGKQLFIKEILATLTEFRESYVNYGSRHMADLNEFSRMWKRGVERWGLAAMPPEPQFNLGI